MAPLRVGVLELVRKEVSAPGEVDFVRLTHNRAATQPARQKLSNKFAFSYGTCWATLEGSESVDGLTPHVWNSYIHLDRATTIELSSEQVAANKRDPNLHVTQVKPSITTVTLRTSGLNGRDDGQVPYLMFYDKDIARQVADVLIAEISSCGGGSQ